MVSLVILGGSKMLHSGAGGKPTVGDDHMLPRGVAAASHGAPSRLPSSSS